MGRLDEVGSFQSGYSFSKKQGVHSKMGLLNKMRPLLQITLADNHGTTIMEEMEADKRLSKFVAPIKEVGYGKFCDNGVTQPFVKKGEMINLMRF